MIHRRLMCQENEQFVDSSNSRYVIPTHLYFLLLVGSVQHDLDRLRAPLLVHRRARDLLQQVQSVLVLHHAQIGHLTLLHDVVRIRFGEAGRLEQTHHFALLHTLAVQVELFFLETGMEK